jgi:hypothetical protein
MHRTDDDADEDNAAKDNNAEDGNTTQIMTQLTPTQMTMRPLLSVVCIVVRCLCLFLHPCVVIWVNVSCIIVCISSLSSVLSSTAVLSLSALSSFLCVVVSHLHRILLSVSLSASLHCCVHQCQLH